jgi:hypothetical protein
VSNSNVPFLVKFNTDLIVGAIVRKGGAAKEVANAELVISINTILLDISNGNVSQGLAALDALETTGDPATIAEIQTATAWISTKAAALQSLLAGSIGGTMASTLIAQVANEAISVAQGYLPKATAEAIPVAGTAAPTVGISG